jgi:hypothetical protein
VIEKPRYGLSWFRISFGRLQLKAYTKGEHALRFTGPQPAPGPAEPPEPVGSERRHHPARTMPRGEPRAVPVRAAL